jgi:hypothetical protein
MTAETDNLVLDHLCALRAGQDALRDDMREVKGRLGHLEQTTAHRDAPQSGRGVK